MITHGPLSSSFLGLHYRTLNMNHKKELLRGLWVLGTWTLRGSAWAGMCGKSSSFCSFTENAKLRA